MEDHPRPDVQDHGRLRPEQTPPRGVQRQRDLHGLRRLAQRQGRQRRHLLDRPDELVERKHAQLQEAPGAQPQPRPDGGTLAPGAEEHLRRRCVDADHLRGAGHRGHPHRQLPEGPEQLLRLADDVGLPARQLQFPLQILPDLLIPRRRLVEIPLRQPLGLLPLGRPFVELQPRESAEEERVDEQRQVAPLVGPDGQQPHADPLRLLFADHRQPGFGQLARLCVRRRARAGLLRLEHGQRAAQVGDHRAVERGSRPRVLRGPHQGDGRLVRQGDARPAALRPAARLVGLRAGDAQHRQDPQPRLRADARNGERQDPSVPVVHVVQHRLQPQPDSRAGRRTEHAPEFRIVETRFNSQFPTSRRWASPRA